GDYFYVMSNDEALDFKIVRTPIADIGSSWEEVVPHRYGRILTDFLLLKDYLVVFQKEDATPGVHVIRADGHEHSIRFPEVGRIEAGRNFEFYLHFLRLTFSSLITHDTIYDYDLENE